MDRRESRQTADRHTGGVESAPRTREQPPATGTVREVGTGPRWVGPVATLVTVLPVWVAVVRAGTSGLFPYSDAATTVLRAQDVFSGPFPLAGMPAAAGSIDSFQVYFPGAWQLYLIALPVRVLGVVWGPLVAMGLINTVWIVLACWAMFRRLRIVEALTGVLLVAMLLWSFGSGFLISPIPMQMVVVPTVLLVIAAWSVADGDIVALPVLALVANYLWLGHLVLVLVVPAVTLCAIVGAVISYRAGPVPATARRSVVAAVLITAIMWIPPVLQQLTVSPGNLRGLVGGAAGERATLGSWGTSVHYLVELITRPWFWLRGTVDDPPYLYLRDDPHVTPGLSLRDLILGVLVLGVLAALFVAARRRRDHTGSWLVVVAVVALGSALVTIHAAPTALGPVREYIWSAWVIAMFVWLAVVVNLLRALRGRHQRHAVWPLFGAIVVFGALDVPTASFGYGTDARQNRVVDEMLDQVVPQLEGRGTFQMQISGIQDSVFGDALVLGARDAGVAYCFPARALRPDGSRPACPDSVTAAVRVRVTDDEAATAAGEVLFRQHLLSPADRAELARLDGAVTDWLAATPDPQLSRRAERRVQEHLGSTVSDPLGWWLGADAGEPARWVDSNEFRLLVRLWYDTAQPGRGGLFADSPVTDDQWRRWITLTDRDRWLVVTEVPATGR